MAYESRWEKLSEALIRVMKAGGLSKDEAQSDICQAIADGAVNIQGKVGRHITKGTYDPTVLEGRDIQIPTEIKSGELDWDESRPVKPWFVRSKPNRHGGPWQLEWIKLSRADVTNVLCTAGEQGKPAQPTSSETGSTTRNRPAFERALGAIKELYPRGVPEQATEPNANLCRRVGDKLKNEGLPDVSDDTILRAAGRRK
jgi:hypothetical protein